MWNHRISGCNYKPFLDKTNLSARLLSIRNKTTKGSNMEEHDKEKNTESEQISCDVCLKEIPASEAKSEEANDYVAHFCGLDCYDQWRHQKKSDNS